jgi:hypothetical protein
MLEGVAAKLLERQKEPCQYSSTAGISIESPDRLEGGPQACSRSFARIFTEAELTSTNQAH